MYVVDISRMVKRRLKDASLPVVPVSAFVSRNHHHRPIRTRRAARRRAAPGPDADPRTTSLYDRRDKQITRNIVERISI